MSASALVALVASSALSAPMDCEQQDRVQIGRQLADIEARLRERDVSAWPTWRRAERARQLDRVHAYRLRGDFPRNNHHPGQCAPYFIDDGGRACAVAHLMIESGYGDLALSIAETENNALLTDMRHPLLTEWILRSGLTAEEQALIQPCYPPPSCSATEECKSYSVVGCSCYVDDVPDGTPCREGTRCASYACRSGQCSLAAPADCDDDDPCTVDDCDPEIGCFHTAVDNCTAGDGCSTAPKEAPPPWLFPLAAALWWARSRRRFPACPR